MRSDVLGEGSNDQPRDKSKESAKERVERMTVSQYFSFEPEFECCRVGESGSKVGDTNKDDG